MSAPSTWSQNPDGSYTSNGFTVSGPILAFVQSATWTVSFDAESALSDPDANGATSQIFSIFELVADASGNVTYGDAGTQLVAAQLQISADATTLASLQGQVSTLQTENADLQQQITALQAGQTDPTAAIAALTAQVTALANTVAAQTATIEDLSTRLAAVEKELADLPADPTPRVAALESEVATLNGDVSTIGQEIMTMPAAIQAATIAAIVGDLTPTATPAPTA